MNKLFSGKMWKIAFLLKPLKIRSYSEACIFGCSCTTVIGGTIECNARCIFLLISSLYVKFNPVLLVDYLSDEVPVKVHLEAFNPCIPLDSKNSGIPVIIFNYTVTNSSSDVAKVQLYYYHASASNHR